MKTNRYTVPIKISINVKAVSYDDAKITALGLLDEIDCNGDISVIKVDEDNIIKHYHSSI